MIKISLLFFLQIFKTMFTKHSLSEIWNVHFEGITVYLTAILRLNGPPFVHQKGYTDVIYLERSEWTQLISYAKHEFENLKLKAPMRQTKKAVRACFA